jgi:hypothetical protein
MSSIAAEPSKSAVPACVLSFITVTYKFDELLIAIADVTG